MNRIRAELSENPGASAGSTTPITGETVSSPHYPSQAGGCWWDTLPGFRSPDLPRRGDLADVAQNYERQRCSLDGGHPAHALFSPPRFHLAQHFHQSSDILFQPPQCQAVYPARWPTLPPPITVCLFSWRHSSCSLRIKQTDPTGTKGAQPSCNCSRQSTLLSGVECRWCMLCQVLVAYAEVVVIAAPSAPRR